MKEFSQLAIETKRMELFCDKREWRLMSVKVNEKNKSQFIAECLDETGMSVFILIGTKGNFWRWTGPKKWEPIKF
ncbi:MULTISPECIES: hypothetical protein [Enterococcus]|uniref:Uncharacterized protein n=1 Tax=Enterococcus thailandicus TaxID=417368 RepID=A0A179EV20_ENTTH|nr:MULTISPECIES: hypothetical protein [Enterococcus]MDT2752920.1 hypothetical protein [Enterococcus thailandicus]MDT2774947.1 hypothetical protein [Enterococcus thailandicus]OAQ57064.1 hypothetical protein A6E74_01425 [Enterococcus thailandicus]OTP23833.1 hypothetical protein A5800_001690 [Enterococcus sp. 5B7_DIV0075]GMC00183.1 hypothetical protein K2F_04420 [Enterococcus thailandicus]